MTDKTILDKISSILQLDYKVKPKIRKYGFCGDDPEFEVAFDGENVVQLGSTKMTAQALELCAALQSLEVLNISCSEVDRFPKALCGLSKLKILNLFNTKITFLPGSIGNLTALEELQFGGTEIIELPDTACNLSQLKILRAQHSGLRKLPENIGELANLKELDIHYSRVNKLPESLVNCKKLSYLWWRFDADNPEIPRAVTANIMANYGETSEMSSFVRFRNCCHHSEFVCQLVMAENTLVQIWNNYDRLLDIDDKTIKSFNGAYVTVNKDGVPYLMEIKHASSGQRHLNDNEKLKPAMLGTGIFLSKYLRGCADITQAEMEGWIPEIYEFYCLDEGYNKNYCDFYDRCKKKLDDIFKERNNGYL